MSWNEFNTFSKLIYPYLKERLGYPERKSLFFDEQTYVRKKGGKSGPYDGAFIDEHKGVLLLVEAKREGKNLTQKDRDQAFDYCLGDEFPIPPPYVLVSNGKERKWFRRTKAGKSDFSYNKCEEISYQKLIEEAGSGSFIEQITLKKLSTTLSQLRKKIFADFTENYFPEGYTFEKSNLKSRELGFRKILNTRKSFVDSSISEQKNEPKAIKSILSSVALSLVLKILFIKIIYDRKSELLPVNFIQKIDQLSSNFPGILKAEPYDVLRISEKCKEHIRVKLMNFRLTRALFFEQTDNPIGYIWDQLITSEELDLQVQSLGNVYTPKPIVKAMVDSAEQTLKTWDNKKILEPACGSGHFVREIYNRMRKFYLDSYPGLKRKPEKIHQKILSSIRAIDIDPFAVQTTQLGMFLELFRVSKLWEALAPDEKFDFSSVVAQGDFLEDGFFKTFPDFKPDLIIGNPPYGIKVTEKTQRHFGLESKDSYAYFILQSINNLKDKGHLFFIVSNTFLMTKSHDKLRKEIFKKTKIKKIMQLHRNAFSGRDVFPCIFHLKKEAVLDKDLDSTYYKFLDAWPIHPKEEDYEVVLSCLKENRAKIKKTKFYSYKIPYRLSYSRLKNPKIKREILKGNFSGRNHLDKTNYTYPVLCGNAGLSLFCSDLPIKNIILEGNKKLLGREVDCLLIKRKGNTIPVIKLWQVASVMQGLATANDQKFLRKSRDVTPNPRRSKMEEISKKNTVFSSQLNRLTEREKKDGIKVLDPSSDKYFVPFDKGGEQDISSGEFNNFWKPVDYWIDWSEKSVRILKRNKKSRFQNSQYYFKKGIACTVTGLYAPTYRLSFGGVFGVKENLISAFDLRLDKYLLMVLSSHVMRYFAKAFIQNTVDFMTNYFHYLPIVVPDQKQLQKANNICDKVIQLKKKNYGKKGLTKEVDKLVEPFVNKLYGLDKEDILEIQTWFKRRYPNFGRG